MNRLTASWLLIVLLVVSSWAVSADQQNPEEVLKAKGLTKFGAVYALARPLVPGPPVAAGIGAAMAEHFGFWPLGALIDRHHPARSELEPLTNNRRAFAQAAWRHLLFGVVLAELERRLNDETEFEPLEKVPISSNGHGNIEQAAVGAGES